MTDILIYGGLSLLLIGLTFILIASIKGAVYTKGLSPTDFTEFNEIKNGFGNIVVRDLFS